MGISPSMNARSEVDASREEQAAGCGKATKSVPCATNPAVRRSGSAPMDHRPALGPTPDRGLPEKATIPSDSHARLLDPLFSA